VSHQIHASDLKPEQIRLGKDSAWHKLPMVGAVLCVAGLGGAVSMMGEHPQEFWYSYLTALMYWLALGLGGMFFTLIQHVSRAGWSIAVRRIGENLMVTLPVLGLLAIPVFTVGIHDLFHWSHESAASDVMLAAKMPYLNEGFFTARGFIYVGLWALISGALYYWSTSQDDAKDPEPLTHKMRWFAPAGLLIFGLTLTFAALDWLMSLDPHWFSTIFGVYYFAGAAICGHAFIAVVVILLQRSGHLNGVVSIEHYHDLGKMMFGFTVFWAYIGFSQYMLIWYASIPEETYWYTYRGEGDWLVLSLILIFGRFVIPFVLFMSRRWKRRASSMAFWAFWMLVIQYLDMYWLIQPVLAHEHGSTEIHFGAMDLLTFVGIGGAFLAVFGWALGRRALIPVNDPRIDESLNFENF
jgi:hypothetical protein